MMISSNGLVSNLFVAASLSAGTPAVSNNNLILSDIQSSVNSSYQSTFYSTKTNASSQNTPIQITKEMLYNAEIEKFKQIILNDFNTKVTATWVPAKDLEDKTCLFVKCDIQYEMKDNFEQLSAFELNLYSTLKDSLENSDFFNMVAIL